MTELKSILFMAYLRIISKENNAEVYAVTIRNVMLP